MVDVKELELLGLKLVTPKVFGDDRGFFLESYNQAKYREAGIDCDFVQDNHSRSVKSVLRGMHFQTLPGQAKLVRVAVGTIYDVAVDIRPESATFGKWTGVQLDAKSHHQLFVPVGFAHGFCVLSDTAEVLYKVSSLFDPETETGFAWDDPEVSIEWPVDDPVVSIRDQKAQSFAELRETLGR